MVEIKRVRFSDILSIDKEEKMNILSMPINDFEVIGLKVKQFATNTPECQGHVGRVSVVIGAFCDENDNMHVLTEDRIWCPSTLLEVVES
jgi:hypothetical protein